MLLDKVYRWFWDKVVHDGDVKRVLAQEIVEGITIKENIPYKDDGMKEHILDVIYPTDAKKPLPVIIDIHGGGLMGGCNLGNRPYCCHLAKAGYIVLAVDYRLSPEYRYPAHLQDVMDALRWIQEHGEELGCDMNNVFLTGDSAGGMLALHAVLVDHDKELADFYGFPQSGLAYNAIALTSGMFEIDKGVISVLTPGILGTWRKKKNKYYEKLDLSKLVRPELIPPCFMVTSEEDFIQSATLNMGIIFDYKNIPYTLENYGKRPDQKLEHVFSVLYPTTPAGQDCIGKMLAFFEANKK